MASPGNLLSRKLQVGNGGPKQRRALQASGKIKTKARLFPKSSTFHGFTSQECEISSSSSSSFKIFMELEEDQEKKLEYQFFAIVGLNCSRCSLNFSSNTHLERHQRFCYNPAFFVPGELEPLLENEHMLKDPSSEMLMCPWCPLLCSSILGLQKHVLGCREVARRRNEADILKQFPCPECSTQSASLEYLLLHLQSHYVGDILCSPCNQAFLSYKTLSHHLQSCTSKKFYKCSDCGGPFIDASQLQKHLPKCKSRTQCLKCAAVVIERRSCDNHMKMHLYAEWAKLGLKLRNGVLYRVRRETNQTITDNTSTITQTASSTMVDESNSKSTCNVSTLQPRSLSSAVTEHPRRSNFVAKKHSAKLSTYDLSVDQASAPSRNFSPTQSDCAIERDRSSLTDEEDHDSCNLLLNVDSWSSDEISVTDNDNFSAEEHGIFDFENALVDAEYENEPEISLNLTGTEQERDPLMPELEEPVNSEALPPSGTASSATSAKESSGTLMPGLLTQGDILKTMLSALNEDSLPDCRTEVEGRDRPSVQTMDTSDLFTPAVADSKSEGDELMLTVVNVEGGANLFNWDDDCGNNIETSEREVGIETHTSCDSAACPTIVGEESCLNEDITDGNEDGDSGIDATDDGDSNKDKTEDREVCNELVDNHTFSEILQLNEAPNATIEVTESVKKPVSCGTTKEVFIADGRMESSEVFVSSSICDNEVIVGCPVEETPNRKKYSVFDEHSYTLISGHLVPWPEQENVGGVGAIKTKPAKKSISRNSNPSIQSTRKTQKKLKKLPQELNSSTSAANKPTTPSMNPASPSTSVRKKELKKSSKKYARSISNAKSILLKKKLQRVKSTKPINEDYKGEASNSYVSSKSLSKASGNCDSSDSPVSTSEVSSSTSSNQVPPGNLNLESIPQVSTLWQTDLNNAFIIQSQNIKSNGVDNGDKMNPLTEVKVTAAKARLHKEEILKNGSCSGASLEKYGKNSTSPSGSNLIFEHQKMNPTETLIPLVRDGQAIAYLKPVLVSELSSTSEGKTSIVESVAKPRSSNSSGTEPLPSSEVPSSQLKCAVLVRKNFAQKRQIIESPKILILRTQKNAVLKSTKRLPTILPKRSGVRESLSTQELLHNDMFPNFASPSTNRSNEIFDLKMLRREQSMISRGFKQIATVFPHRKDTCKTNLPNTTAKAAKGILDSRHHPNLVSFDICSPPADKDLPMKSSTLPNESEKTEEPNIARPNAPTSTNSLMFIMSSDGALLPHPNFSQLPPAVTRCSKENLPPPCYVTEPSVLNYNSILIGEEQKMEPRGKIFPNEETNITVDEKNERYEANKTNVINILDERAEPSASECISTSPLVVAPGKSNDLMKSDLMEESTIITDSTAGNSAESTSTEQTSVDIVETSPLINTTSKKQDIFTKKSESLMLTDLRSCALDLGHLNTVLTSSPSDKDSVEDTPDTVRRSDNESLSSPLTIKLANLEVESGEKEFPGEKIALVNSIFREERPDSSIGVPESLERKGILGSATTASESEKSDYFSGNETVPLQPTNERLSVSLSSIHEPIESSKFDSLVSENLDAVSGLSTPPNLTRFEICDMELFSDSSSISESDSADAQCSDQQADESREDAPNMCGPSCEEPNSQLDADLCCNDDRRDPTDISAMNPSTQNESSILCKSASEEIHIIDLLKNLRLVDCQVKKAIRKRQKRSSSSLFRSNLLTSRKLMSEMKRFRRKKFGHEGLQKKTSTQIFICGLCAQCFHTSDTLKHHICLKSLILEKLTSDHFDRFFDVGKEREKIEEYQEEPDEPMVNKSKKNVLNTGMSPLETYFSMKQGNRKRQFSCEKCQINFKSFSALLDHKTDFHTENSSLSCHICGKEFSRLQKLAVHFAKSHKSISVSAENEEEIKGLKRKSQNSRKDGVSKWAESAACHKSPTSNSGKYGDSSIIEPVSSRKVESLNFDGSDTEKSAGISYSALLVNPEKDNSVCNNTVPDKQQKCCNPGNSEVTAEGNRLNHKVSLPSENSNLCSEDDSNHCKICNKTFNAKGGLKSHMNQVHATVYKCPICLRRFTYLTTMKIHFMKHIVSSASAQAEPLDESAVNSSLAVEQVDDSMKLPKRKESEILPNCRLSEEEVDNPMELPNRKEEELQVVEKRTENVSLPGRLENVEIPDMVVQSNEIPVGSTEPTSLSLQNNELKSDNVLTNSKEHQNTIENVTTSSVLPEDAHVKRIDLKRKEDEDGSSNIYSNGILSFPQIDRGCSKQPQNSVSPTSPSKKLKKSKWMIVKGSSSVEVASPESSTAIPCNNSDANSCSTFTGIPKLIMSLSKIKKNRYKCEDCSKGFKKQHHLALHRLEAHINSGPFTCPICHKEQSDSIQLQAHLMLCNPAKGSSGKVGHVNKESSDLFEVAMSGPDIFGVTDDGISGQPNQPVKISAAVKDPPTSSQFNAVCAVPKAKFGIQDEIVVPISESSNARNVSDIPNQDNQISRIKEIESYAQENKVNPIVKKTKEVPEAQCCSEDAQSMPISNLSSEIQPLPPRSDSILYNSSEGNFSERRETRYQAFSDSLRKEQTSSCVRKKSISKIGLWKCRNCQLDFKSKGFLERHNIQNHGAPSKFNCPYCGRIFTDSRSLRFHHKTKHPKKKWLLTPNKSIETSDGSSLNSVETRNSTSLYPGQIPVSSSCAESMDVSTLETLKEKTVTNFQTLSSSQHDLKKSTKCKKCYKTFQRGIDLKKHYREKHHTRPAIARHKQMPPLDTSRAAEEPLITVVQADSTKSISATISTGEPVFEGVGDMIPVRKSSRKRRVNVRWIEEMEDDLDFKRPRRSESRGKASVPKESNRELQSQDQPSPPNENNQEFQSQCKPSLPKENNEEVQSEDHPSPFNEKNQESQIQCNNPSLPKENNEELQSKDHSSSLNENHEEPQSQCNNPSLTKENKEELQSEGQKSSLPNDTNQEFLADINSFSDEVETLKCADCPLSYRTFSCLKRHRILVHAEPASHYCQICGKGFSYPHTLKNHVKTHSRGTHRTKRCKVYGEREDASLNDQGKECQSSDVIEACPNKDEVGVGHVGGKDDELIDPNSSKIKPFTDETAKEATQKEVCLNTDERSLDSTTDFATESATSPPEVRTNEKYCDGFSPANVEVNFGVATMTSDSPGNSIAQTPLVGYPLPEVNNEKENDQPTVIATSPLSSELQPSSDQVSAPDSLTEHSSGECSDTRDQELPRSAFLTSPLSVSHPATSWEPPAPLSDVSISYGSATIPYTPPRPSFNSYVSLPQPSVSAELSSWNNYDPSSLMSLDIVTPNRSGMPWTSGVDTSGVPPSLAEMKALNTCSFCGLCLPSWTALQEHYYIAHPHPNMESTPQFFAAPQTVPIPWTSPWKNNIQPQYWTQSISPSKIPDNGGSYFQQLTSHSVVHCSLCGMCFPTLHALQEHYTTHNIYTPPKAPSFPYAGLY